MTRQWTLTASVCEIITRQWTLTLQLLSQSHQLSGFLKNWPITLHGCCWDCVHWTVSLESHLNAPLWMCSHVWLKHWWSSVPGGSGQAGLGHSGLISLFTVGSHIGCVGLSLSLVSLSLTW